jgi:cobalt-zinc-cadmium efflux system protein
MSFFRGKMSDHHEHHHHHEVEGKNLFITVFLNIIITISQVIGGIISGSIALQTDALHNFSDVIALLVTYVSNKLSKKEADNKKTFGYKRAEILGALFNSATLIGISAFLVIEAIKKLFQPEKIDSLWVISLAILSIILNFASVLLIKSDSHKNINIKSAYLHLLTDVFTSVAVLIGGLFIYFFNIIWIDPVISIFIAIYLFYSSFDILKESVSILMQFTPKNIDIEEVKISVESNDNVKNIHHLHLWKLDEHRIFLELHLEFKENILLGDVTNIIKNIKKSLIEEYNISHITIESEFDGCKNKDLLY